MDAMSEIYQLFHKSVTLISTCILIYLTFIFYKKRESKFPFILFELKSVKSSLVIKLNSNAAI